jgi:hypothetical protein
MKRRGIFHLLTILVILLLIGLACSSQATPTPTVFIIQPTQTQLSQTQPPTATATTQGAGIQQYTKVSDIDNLFTADVPSDWTRSSFWAYSPIQTAGEHPEHTPDTLEFAYLSPDQHGAVVFLEYNDNHGVSLPQLGDLATLILNNFFGGGEDSVNISFGKGGDSVNITKKNQLTDGSVQLSWGLVKNKVVGTTYAYTRGNTIIVLSTFCDEAFLEVFANTFTHIINTFKVP